MGEALRRRWNQLEAVLRQHKRILVAFSGGCDSTFLLAAARKTLGKENILAVTAVSASLAQRERFEAASLAALLDAPHQSIATNELQNSDYRANPSNRCFFCKDELFRSLSPMAKELQMVLADGLNASDRLEIRPGIHAAHQWKVRHPLEAAHLTKRDVRVLSRWLGLRTWNKPASPCLSSRIPYGTAVTPGILRQIEAAEDVLHREGFPVVRVRHYGEQARIEVPLRDLERLQDAMRWLRIVGQLQNAGYQEVIADPRGFRSGRLNGKEENRFPDAHAYEKSL